MFNTTETALQQSRVTGSTTRALSISVVICAYTEERWDALTEALESVQRQTVAPEEIIVVIDHNARLLERARQRFADVSVIANSRAQGDAGARNMGSLAAHGDVIAFLDDDAAAEPDWLAWLLEGYADERVLGVGGFIEPRWLSGEPRWFPEEFYWVLGCTYRGVPETTAVMRNLIAANMSIRREIFESAGGFLDELARVGARPIGIHETELCIRIGQRWPSRFFLYEPRARVQHRVPEKRLRYSYFRSLCYNEGIAKALMPRLVGTRDNLSTERNYAYRTLPKGVIRGLADTVIHHDPSGMMRAGMIVSGLASAVTGYIVGTLLPRMSIRGLKESPHPAVPQSET